MSAGNGKDPKGRALVAASLGAVGVVYGDIGTSPLYAMKECFAYDPLRPALSHGMPVTPENVLGILSLFFYALTCVVVIKYLTFMLRADNNGEGGILALLALLKVKEGRDGRVAGVGAALVGLGLFGAALLYGDGIITPAISVLSAVEGLEVATPRSPGVLKDYVVPLTVLILSGLFWMQRHGTKRIGTLFGPAMLLWFSAITVAGAPWVFRNPEVLGAVNPLHAVRFFAAHGKHGFLILGSVVLCVTGGEALYADMGHFGRGPIRLAWYAIVFPALLVNYFGQGAYLLERGQAGAATPFFGLTPEWAVVPMVIIATVATVVASQALISGAFSLSNQAVQLGYSPRVTIVHTSGATEGQIYVPEINSMLWIACIALVLAFPSSTKLAAAYGIAVTGTMAITSILFFALMYKRWGLAKTLPLVAFFLLFDLSFLGANIIKVAHGGWVPLVVGAVVFTILTTWKRGRAALYEYIKRRTLDMDDFVAELDHRKLHRIPGTGVFMASNPKGAPPVLVHHVKHNKVLHENVILLSILTEHEPVVAKERRVETREIGHGIHHVTARFGFMQSPSVKEILLRAKAAGVPCDYEEATYYLGRETLLVDGDAPMMRWRKGLFAFLSRNARPATAFFQIPPDRVVELGMQIQL
jgi:KUP system potassium uptake protein